MRPAVLFFLALSALPASAASNLLYEGTDKVGYFEKGVPYKGYWSIQKGKPKKYLGAHDKATKLYKNGDRYKLIHREAKPLLSGGTPMPNPPLKMTPQTCSKVDLAPKMGPCRNQTGGTCYAYTATELMNFGLYPKTYSAMHLATLRGKDDQEKAAAIDESKPLASLGGWNGGFVGSAIKLGMDNGMCPDEYLPSVAKNLNPAYKKLIAYYIQVTKRKGQLDDECQLFLKEHGGESPEKLMAIILGKGIERDQIWKSEEVQEEVKRLYPTVPLERVKEIQAASKDPDDFVKDMAVEVCKNHLVKPVPPGKKPTDVKETRNNFKEGGKSWYYEEDRTELLDKLNAALNSGRPAGISYVTGGLIQPPKTEDHAFHASAVAGRNWLPEERDASGKVVTPAGCYYKIKNSWGEDWKVKDGLKARSSSANPGYFIVSEKQLMEHLYGVTTID